MVLLVVQQGGDAVFSPPLTAPSCTLLHPLAPCVVLKYEKKDLVGLVRIGTDDFLGGGRGPAWEQALEKLQKVYTFGKFKWLQKEATEYSGRTLQQLSDFSITISMHRYLQPAHETKLERGRGKDQKEKATEAELSKMRGLNGKLQWATRNGMPQGVGDASMLAHRTSLGVLAS